MEKLTGEWCVLLNNGHVLPFTSGTSDVNPLDTDPRLTRVDGHLSLHANAAVDLKLNHDPGDATRVLIPDGEVELVFHRSTGWRDSLRPGLRCFVILKGFGYDRIAYVELGDEIRRNNVIIGYNLGSYDVDGSFVGSSGATCDAFFPTLTEAEAERTRLAVIAREDMRRRTATPELMINYLLSCINTEHDGFVDTYVNDDIRRRTRIMFGLDE